MIEYGLLKLISKVAYRKDVRELLPKFEMIHVDMPPLMRYIPPNHEARREVRKAFRYAFNGATFPDYKNIHTNPDNRVNLRVLWCKWNVKFKYNDITYDITFKPGFVTDGASVPPVLVHDHITRNGQVILPAYLVHDLIFEETMFNFEDTAIIFRGILEYMNEYYKDDDGKLPLSKSDIDQYYFGVRSMIARRLYHEASDRHGTYDNMYTIQIQM